jgi:hypothetical protein
MGRRGRSLVPKGKGSFSREKAALTFRFSKIWFGTRSQRSRHSGLPSVLASRNPPFPFASVTTLVAKALLVHRRDIQLPV